MKYIKPAVEWWPQQSLTQQIARTGRICYKSQGAQPSETLTAEEREQFFAESDTRRTQAFWESGHRSMYRHGTVYYFVPNAHELPNWAYCTFGADPYINCICMKNNGPAWLSTNAQWMMEHTKLSALLQPYVVSEDEFIAHIQEYPQSARARKAFNLLRMTMVVTTQISTTRELNRTSPNNISEQSTRYVNLGKKGGVGIAVPHWWPSGTRWQKILFNCGCKVCEWVYLLLLRSGMKPQDARGVLPLDTFSRVAYTYNLYEWRHILDLRLRGTTGAPHPNARIVAAEVHRIINERMQILCPGFQI